MSMKMVLKSVGIINRLLRLDGTNSTVLPQHPSSETKYCVLHESKSIRAQGYEHHMCRNESLW